jgi:hypothetical protein
MYLQEAEIEIDPAQLEAYKVAVIEHIEPPPVLSRAFSPYTPFLKRIIPHASGYSKSTGM